MVGTGNRSDLLFAFSGQDSYQGGDSREEQAKLNPEFLYSFQWFPAHVQHVSTNDFASSALGRMAGSVKLLGWFWLSCLGSFS